MDFILGEEAVIAVLLRRLQSLFAESSSKSMVEVGGVSPDVMSPGQAVFFCNVLDGRK